MARAPQPGRVKTRLQPVFSPEECAEIQRVLVRRTTRWAAAVAAPGAAYVAHHPPQGWGDLRGLVPPGVEPIAQTGEHLGERLTNAVGEVFERRRRTAASPEAAAQPAGAAAPGGAAALPAGAAAPGGAAAQPGTAEQPATAAAAPECPLLVVGVDTRLTSAHAIEALEQLAHADVVVG